MCELGCQSISEVGRDWPLKGKGELVREIGNGLKSRCLVMIVFANTQVRAIWARLGCINGPSMLESAFGWSAIIVKARRVRWPHSFEWGR